MGRRNTIRAFYYKSCFFPVKTKRLRLLLKIFELSVSHFMVSIKKGEEELLDLKEYVKIPKVTFNMRVLCFIYNAILYMIRDFDDEIIYVFAFLVIMIRLGLIFKRKKLLFRKCMTLSTVFILMF